MPRGFPVSWVPGICDEYNGGMSGPRQHAEFLRLQCWNFTGAGTGVFEEVSGLGTMAGKVQERLTDPEGQSNSTCHQKQSRIGKASSLKDGSLH